MTEEEKAALRKLSQTTQSRALVAGDLTALNALINKELQSIQVTA